MSVDFPDTWSSARRFQLTRSGRNTHNFIEPVFYTHPAHALSRYKYPASTPTTRCRCFTMRHANTRFLFQAPFFCLLILLHTSACLLLFLPHHAIERRPRRLTNSLHTTLEGRSFIPYISTHLMDQPARARPTHSPAASSGTRRPRALFSSAKHSTSKLLFRTSVLVQ